MPSWPPAWPASERVLLRNARSPAILLDRPVPGADRESLVDLDLLIEGGRIAALGAPGTLPAEGAAVADLDRGLVLPGFVEAHTHLDKGHIWPRRPNPDGTWASALDNVRADRAARWSAEDVRRRMDFALRCAYAHGTVAIRTHLDSIGEQVGISWPVFAAMREAWAGRIALQAIPLAFIDDLMDEAFFAEILAAVQRYGTGQLGAVTAMTPSLRPGLDRLFRTAAEHGLDLDFHVDETEDPTANSLAVIAETAIATRFPGKVLVGHCCSLARQDEGEADRTMDLVAEAGLAVVSLPMCNLYLQDRHPGRTPRWRGVTLLHELAARGVAVMVSSDNTRDPFYAYGDLDPVEVFREAARIVHLDHPFAEWPRVITAAPAALMRMADRGVISAGQPADLVLFRARTLNELLARPQADRVVLRGGTPIDRTLPDYRELDDLMGPMQ